VNYRMAGRHVAMVKRAGIGNVLQRFAIRGLKRVSEKLPSRVAGLGAKVQSGAGKLAGKLGFSGAAKRLGQKATGARQMLGLGEISPWQKKIIGWTTTRSGDLGRVARGSSKNLGSAFRTGLGTLGVGGAIGAAGLHDAATGKLLSGGAQPEQA